MPAPALQPSLECRCGRWTGAAASISRQVAGPFCLFSACVASMRPCMHPHELHAPWPAGCVLLHCMPPLNLGANCTVSALAGTAPRLLRRRPESLLLAVRAWVEVLKCGQAPRPQHNWDVLCRLAHCSPLPIPPACPIAHESMRSTAAAVLERLWTLAWCPSRCVCSQPFAASQPTSMHAASPLALSAPFLGQQGSRRRGMPEIASCICAPLPAHHSC